jgi:type IV/VI secretion system ImpK/VasF family protein
MKSASNCRYPHVAMLVCAEIIVIVTEAAKETAACNLEELHDRICAKFDSVIKECKINLLSEDAALELLYPLAALVDETFLSVPRYRYYWAERPLQLRYFGEAAAGTELFSRLEKHMKAKVPKVEVLDLYFIALALGLKGMYSARDDRRCVKIFENLGVMLRNIRRKGREAAAAPVSVDKRESVMPRLITPAVYLGLLTLITIVTAVIYFTSRAGLLKILNHF